MSAINNTKTKNGYAIFSFENPEDEWRCFAPPLIFWVFVLTRLATAIFLAMLKKMWVWVTSGLVTKHSNHILKQLLKTLRPS